MDKEETSTIYVEAFDLYGENFTTQHTAGRNGGQAECITNSGDRMTFRNVAMKANQDGVRFDNASRSYMKDCYIEGTVDFIFGWSTAVFNRCHIHSKRSGYVTAPSTDRGQKYGYLFYGCRLTADDGVKDVYLSRPWRPYAQAVFVRCDLGGHIVPAGWHNWGKKEAEKTVFYAEYENTGEGAHPKARAPFSRQLKNLKGYEMEDVLAGNDGWNPMKGAEGAHVANR